MMDGSDVSSFQWSLHSSWRSALGWLLSEADPETSMYVQMVYLGHDGGKGEGRESREEKEDYKSVLTAIAMDNYNSVL